MTSHEKFLKVDSVSPSFCAAKWTQVTIDLQHGTNHSCHHPIRHKVPEKELLRDVSALHNTKFKKKLRKKMLAGKRPKECEYCWQIEDSAGAKRSDRYLKSIDSWSYDRIEEIAKSAWDENVAPTYLEVFFSNRCNLSCSYCMADVSSSIEKEMKQYGPYPIKDRVMKKHRQYSCKKPKEENLYRDAFWQWLPQVYHDLRVLRITGGEPLLDENFDRLMDYMISNPHEHLTFAVNSNFCLPEKRMDDFFDKLKTLQDKTKVKIELYTSADTYGKHAEYIRAGFQYDLFLKRCFEVQSRFPDIQLTVMCCFNLLSIPRFGQFITDMAKLKESGLFHLDISYLKDPGYLCSKIAREEDKKLVKQWVLLMREKLFTPYEVQKLERIYLLLKSFSPEQFKKEHRDFVLFINEYDKRKGFSFAQTFPEAQAYLNVE